MRRLRYLSTREGRERESLLLLEGTKLLTELLLTSEKPESIIATTSWLESHSELINSIPNKTLIYEVTPEVLKASLTTVSPDGVASLISLNVLPKSNENSNFILALDRLQDPGNLGSLLRTALAAEVDDIWLGSGVDPLGQKVLRASSGAVFHLPYMRLGPSEKEGVEQMAAKLRFASSKGFQVVGTFVPKSSANFSLIPYWELDWTKQTVLVLGNEGSGLHISLQQCCTHSVTLPHSSLVDSLNVAAAAVPLLLERRRAKMIFTSQQQG